MTVVFGTAGHIDHGKTTLLRALTGVDADRLPEEQRRGMTIDVGYAHLTLADGTDIDFVDVPGHDRLVGNMLVGAGEIDAAMLVVAADDGPRAQTLEHLELLDGLGIRHGLVAITKIDAVDGVRVDTVSRQVTELVARTTLAGCRVVAVSAATGAGLTPLLESLVRVRDDVRDAGGARGGVRLAVDRVFGVAGRGLVVTGTLRGAGALEAGATVRVLAGSEEARIREVQVHGRAVGAAEAGRTALNLAGIAAERIERGSVLAAGPGVVVSDRLLVVLRAPATFGAVAARGATVGARVRLHLGTAQAEALVTRAGRDVTVDGDWQPAVLRLDRQVAVAIGDRFVLRRPSPAATVAGGVVLDPVPPAGPALRRMTGIRLGAAASAVENRDPAAVVAALVDLHGAVPAGRIAEAWDAISGSRPAQPGLLQAGTLVLARDVAAAMAEELLAAVTAAHESEPLEPGLLLEAARRTATASLRRQARVAEALARSAAAGVVDATVAAGRLERHDQHLALPGRPVTLPASVREAMDRLEALLSVASPPSLAEAALSAGCPAAGVRALEAERRIVLLTPDIAFATPTLSELEARAVAMAAEGPLRPAAYRDAIGSSRKYVMAILEDLDRREVLHRTPDGHVPGRRARVGARAS